MKGYWIVGVVIGVVMLVLAVMAWWRWGFSPFPERTTMFPGQRIPHLYKWSRHRNDMAKWSIAYADAHVRRIDGQDYELAPIHPDCYFKINHEIHSMASPRDDHQELVIEVKMVMTREVLDDEHFYVLRLRPLRGTDFWPVIKKFTTALGEPHTMTIARDFRGGDLPGAYSTQDVELTWTIGQAPAEMEMP